MSGIDFNMPGLQQDFTLQGNYMPTFPAAQQFVFDAINAPVMVKNDLSSRGKPVAGDRSEGFAYSNPEFPAPTSTEPLAEPTLPNGVSVVGPWPIVPVMPGTSITANDPNLPALDASAPSDAANPAQPVSSSQPNQPWDDPQWLQDRGLDPNLFDAFNGISPESNAAQAPASNEPIDFGLLNNFNAPVENNGQGSITTAVNQTIAPAPGVPQHLNVQIPQLHAPQPLPPLFDPEFGNGGANNLVAQTSGYSALNVNGFSSMGMAADGGFNPPATAGRSATAQRRSQRRQAPQFAQASQQAQRRRAPQFAQAPQQTQLVQDPQLDAQFLLAQQMAMNGANTFMPQLADPGPALQSSGASAMVMNDGVQNSSAPGPAAFVMGPQPMMMPNGNQAFGQHPSALTTNGTSQLVATQPNFQPLFFPDFGTAQMPNTVAQAPFAGTSTPANPQRRNNSNSTATVMKHYAQKSFELEEQKKKNEILSAQVQQLMAREGQVQARLQLMSSMVQPAETAVPPPVAPQPGPSSSSAVVSSQLVANTSSAVPPPPLPPQQLEVPTAFEPTSFTANAEQSYNFDLLSDNVPGFPDFDLPSDALPTFPDFAQEFGTVPPSPFSAAPFEDPWQQPIDFDGMPQVILDLSQQQQQGLMFPVQPYPQINGFDQLSNRGPEEHHLGTLQQQQVEQVLPYGNLPQEQHNLTNGNHYQQGNGATASSSTSSSKRKRDENEERANNQQEAGGGPSPPKRKRTRSRENKSGDKGKGREVVTATTTVNKNTPSTSSKRKRDEAGDDTGASNEAGGSGSAQPPKRQKKQDLGADETPPMKIHDALLFLRQHRFCEWGDGTCNQVIREDVGAYWKHIQEFHSPCYSTDNSGGIRVHCSGCGFGVPIERMATHLDTRKKHVEKKWLKCVGCCKEVSFKEMENPEMHFKDKCEEGMVVVVIPRQPSEVIKENMLAMPEDVSQAMKERYMADMVHSMEVIRKRNEERRRNLEIDGQRQV